MLYRKWVINVLLVAAMASVVYFSINRTEHGDREQWMQKHAVVAQRRGDINKFCIDCHQKQFGHTKENFCNKCHAQNKVKLVK